MSLKNCDDSTVPQRSGKGTAHSLWLYNQDIILTTGLGYNCGVAVETWHYACVPDRWSSVVIDGHAEHLPDAEVVKCPILSCPGVPETEPSVLKLWPDRRPNDMFCGWSHSSVNPLRRQHQGLWMQNGVLSTADRSNDIEALSRTSAGITAEPPALCCLDTRRTSCCRSPGLKSGQCGRLSR